MVKKNISSPSKTENAKKNNKMFGLFPAKRIFAFGKRKFIP